MSFDWAQVIRPCLVKPTAAELDGFEEAIGFALPIDYRDFMLAFNGGTVLVEHDIHVPALSCEVFVSNFLPLTEERPSLGLVEARLMQEELRLCLRQALRIGGDMGTGFFYLLLAGDETGAVYYGFKDDIPEPSHRKCA